MAWEVYIIEAQSGKLYTGITNDLERRFSAHKQRKRGAKFFYFSQPKKVLFREAHPDRKSASKRESAIKKMSRLEKLLLCEKSV